MAIRDLTSERLYLTADLADGVSVVLDEAQAHYLVKVLRLSPGAKVLVFNGRDGEWAAQLQDVRKRGAILLVMEQTRPQQNGPDIDYLFAPLKRSRLDYMVQKATEMGVARLRPVITQRTIAERVNTQRMTANAIEAAEQCGILRVPDVLEPLPLERVLATWDAVRPLIFCDEGCDRSDPIKVLGAIQTRSVAVLIGPEGGFTPHERDMMNTRPGVVPVSLGPRIMRADTAAVAALALVNAVIGDWRPH